MKTPYNNSSMGMKLLYLTTAVYVKQRKTTKSRAIKLRMLSYCIAQNLSRMNLNTYFFVATEYIYGRKSSHQFDKEMSTTEEYKQ
jgi:hypothetical protein